jgi:predicted DNA-binding transcriptional regulator AlpA
MSTCLSAPSVRQEYLCQRDAAILLGRSVAFVQKLERAGNFVQKFRVGNSAMYRVDDIRAWMERHAQ